MSAAVQREYLQLGAYGKIPTDSLFELSVETANGETLTFHQTRRSKSIVIYKATAIRLAVDSSKVCLLYSFKTFLLIQWKRFWRFNSFANGVT